MIARRLASALGLFLLAAAAPLAAQLAPITVPRGQLRLDFGGRFDWWDRRFLNGTKQDAAADFSRDPLDGGFLTDLAVDEAELRRITGVQAISLSLGKSTSSMLVNIGTASIGAAYGLGRRITIFGTVPIVRVRVQNSFTVDTTGATAGFNPAHPLFGDATLAAQTALFLGQLDASLATLTSKLAAGDYDGNPAQKALAQQTLAQGTALQSDLESLLLTATFLPLAGTIAAGAITTPIETLRSNITSLSVSGFTAAPAFPALQIDGAAFDDYITRTAGPIAGRALQPPILQYIGDIEVGAAFAWLEHRPARGLAFRSVIQGTVRLRTGRLDLPDSFFDVSTGDRQPDVQGDLVTDVMGGGFGARVTGRYVYQLPGRLTRRISPPGQPIAPAASAAALERDPGEILELGIEPYVRLGPTLALMAGVRRWSKGADRYTYVPNQTPIEGLDPEVLAIDSRDNGTVLSAGLSFVHDGKRRNGTIGFPMDASLRWDRVIGSSLGRVPVKHSVTMQLRLYRKLF